MNVLVTGGAGFIGKHLVDRLVEHGETVTVIDNLSFGKRSHVPPSVELIELDLGKATPADLVAILERIKPEAIYHLAAIHFIPYCMEHPDEAFASNVQATNTLIAAMQKVPVKKFVFSSTMDVYQARDVVHSEQHPPEPANIYGLTKYLSEVAIEYAQRIGACGSATVFRFANVYGPNETNPHVIPDAIRKIGDRAANAVRMGYLGAERDFVYVADVAAALHAGGQKHDAGFARYNLGTGISRPVRAIIQDLQRLMGDNRPLEEDQRQFRKFDRPTLTPDIAAIRSELGWSAAMPIDEGLRRTVESETA